MGERIGSPYPRHALQGKGLGVLSYKSFLSFLMRAFPIHWSTPRLPKAVVLCLCSVADKRS